MTQKKRGGVRKKIGNENHVSKRNKEKYRALKPELQLKSRYEETVDVASCINDPNITEEEREWMNTFMQEYTCANFNHGKEILHNITEEAPAIKLRIQEISKDISKTKDIETLTRLYAEKEQLQEYYYETANQKAGCYNRNNVRNRCQMTRKKSSGELVSTEDLRVQELGKEAPDQSAETDN